MINNNNNKEGQMTHRLNTQTFDFKGQTFKKGVDNYAYVSAKFIVDNSEKIQFSYVDKYYMIHNDDVSVETANAWIDDKRNTPYRILVNRRGSALGCIIYLGGE
jgi:hypothetical protein